MFCCHVIRAMEHVQAEYVPSRYVLKRYTREPNVDIGFDRHEKIFIEMDAGSRSHRNAMILPDLYVFARSAVKTNEVRL